jgi:hypothetical protein
VRLEAGRRRTTGRRCGEFANAEVLNGSEVMKLLLSRSSSKRRHTAHEHLVEGRIYYRFHPRCGETVMIARRLEYRGVELVVVLQPDSSLACIPAWMTREAAVQYTLSDKPHFSVDILRSLRSEIDALSRLSPARIKDGGSR